MYDRILVAYNASKNSEIALREAIGIARVSKAELYVLGIVSSTGTFGTVDSIGPLDVVGLELNRIQQALEVVSSRLSEHGFSVSTSVRQGNPADEIISLAWRIKADLVVVGHSNKGILARWFQGSIGAKLLVELPCSLLIAAAR